MLISKRCRENASFPRLHFVVKLPHKGASVRYYFHQDVKGDDLLDPQRYASFFPDIMVKKNISKSDDDDETSTEGIVTAK